MDVSLVENRRIQVLTRNVTSFAQSFTMKSGQDPTNLDELTNQVFEDLLQNKNPELIKLPSDQGSIKVSKTHYVLSITLFYFIIKLLFIVFEYSFINYLFIL